MFDQKDEATKGGELRVSVDRARLAEALGEQADLGGALGGVLDTLTAEMSTPAQLAKASGPRARSAFQRGEELKAHLTVDQLSESFSARAKSLLARYLEGSKERRERGEGNFTLTG